MAETETKPLCVDLDGTLIRTDLLWESLLELLRRAPLRIFEVPFWLASGKPVLKRRLAQAAPPDVASLPYREEFLQWLREERSAGRPLILVSASDEILVKEVARHLGIFAESFGSDGRTNLKGARKRALLVERYGTAGFDYAGDSDADVPCWESAGSAIVVGASGSTLRKARQNARVGRVVEDKSPALPPLASAMRLNQWVKNLLLFAPLLLAHRAGEAALIVTAALAFLVFSLCAAATYIVNDLLDLPSDRLHPHKRKRPFAAGRVTIRSGLLLAAATGTGGLALSAALLPAGFALIVLGYMAVSLLYTFRLKKVAVADVMILAGLYCMRLVAGGIVVRVPLSAWTLAFALFLFLSLAFLKRFTELSVTEGAGTAPAGERYSARDGAWLAGVGLGSGLISVLVLALYINSPEVQVLHRRPELLWIVCPLQLYWITRLWLLAHRKEIVDDPIAVTFSDKASYLVALAACAAVWFAI